MAEYNTPCRVCKHYDHHFGLPYEDEIIFKKMCWTGRMWDMNCECKKHVSTNLGYLEWKYEQKNKKSKKF